MGVRVRLRVGAGVNLDGSDDGIAEGADVTGKDEMGAGVNLDGSFDGFVEDAE